ncbi:MAG: pyrroline-5-carboxylate reductase [Lachnospiraceae bacterium]|nr:pyrroline-5-carboxylate reductase [Lachnospiraceae bacterium]
MKIGFIGLGNMAGAMLGGLVKKGFSPADLYGYDVATALADKRKEELGMQICASNKEVVENAEYLVLAVKPQFLAPVLEEIKPALKATTVIISIVAGKSIAWITELLGEVKVVRCMPNTAALVGEAITAMTPSKTVTEEELAKAKEIIESFGRASVVAEHLMDAVVGVSGSAPAYVFMFIEAMADAAVLEGMPRAQAYEFAAQAVYGSAKLMLDTGKHPGELKDMVCSPAGTTIAAVRTMEDKGLRSAVMEGVIAAAEKNKQL